MARFWVEFIDHGVVDAAMTVDAPSALQAAEKAANGTVGQRREDDSCFIRVTPVRKSTAYEFVRR